MIKSKKNLLLIIPISAPLFTTAVKGMEINHLVESNEINNYNLKIAPNNVEEAVVAIKRKLKGKKIKFYNRPLVIPSCLLKIVV